MRMLRTMGASLVLLSMTILGGGSANLAAPTPAHADPTSNTQSNPLLRGNHRIPSETVNGFTLTPTKGPANKDATATITTPKPDTNYTQVSAGDTHMLAIGLDGYVYARSVGRPPTDWPNHNTFGELGTGETNSHLGWVKSATPPGVHFKEVSAGTDFSLALTDNGQIYSWGYNTYGQLGIDSGAVSIARPTLVGQGELPVGQTYTHISAGGNHSMALSSEGQVYCWGYNGYGQIGVNSNALNYNAYHPRKVVQGDLPIGQKYTSISARYDLSLAISNANHLYYWGMREYLSPGTNSARLPKLVANGDIPPGQTIKQVSGNYALATDGKVYAWPIHATSSVPQLPKLLPSSQRFTYISGPFAIDTSGHLYGSDLDGGSQDSTGTYIQITGQPDITLTHISNGFTTLSGTVPRFKFLVARDTLGNYYNVYNYSGGKGASNLRPWSKIFNQTVTITSVGFGANPVTQYWVDSRTGDWNLHVPIAPQSKVEVPVAYQVFIDSLPTTNETITLHYEYKNAYTVSFSLGDGTGHASTPLPASQEVFDQEQADWPTPLPSWSGHPFAGWFTDSGSPWNFADGVQSTMTLTARWDGDSTFTIAPATGPIRGGTTVTVSANPTRQRIRFTQVTGGSNYSLALGSNGQVYAWGANASGQLGDVTNTERHTPVRAHLPATTTYSTIAAGSQHALAIGRDGNAYTWGLNANGQLGNGNTSNSSQPVRFPLPAGVNALQGAAGADYTIILADDGNLYATGNNASGQLGDTTTTSHTSPVTIAPPAGVTFTALAAGGAHVLALTDTGRIYAWGSNSSGQLGVTGANATSPQAVPLPASITIKQIVAGDEFSAALSNNRDLYTWGNNTYGQLGDGTTTSHSAPTGIPAPSTPVRIAAGGSHMLAITNTDALYAWGANTNGQQGDGYTSPNTSPYRINPPTGITYTHLGAGTSHSLATDTNGDLYTWGNNANGQLASNDTVEQHRAINGHSFDNAITAVTLDGRPATVSSTGVGTWTGNTPAHPEANVPVTVTWTSNGETQPNYTIINGFYYYTYQTLPAAGTIPIYRLTGTTLIALSAITAVSLTGHHLTRARKRDQGKHSLRPNQTNSRS
ncbi:hypothetical protein KIM372_12650 [Bombiscardovia nodaiensis]|uniref:RCC1-like domain-containing protein n=1 Tax=Bombiscardovia nodaiensis TaxID=2932181 RepID=A0ABM8B9B9_9BIFI|nr:hypothetical protein KIM372_12650 [Bombiscardovia nodaiensis]